MRKGEISLGKLFTGLIVLSMLSVGLFTFMGDLLGNYELEGAPQLNANETKVYNDFNILDDLENNATGFSAILEVGSKDKPSILQYFLLAPAILWEAIKMLFAIPKMIILMVVTAMGIFSLPAWVLTAINAGIIMLVALLILSAIIKWRMN